MYNGHIHIQNLLKSLKMFYNWHNQSAASAERSSQVLVVLNLPAQQQGVDTTGEVGTREAVGPRDGSLIDVETYWKLPTKTVNLVILEELIASVANPSQQRKLGPGKWWLSQEYFWSSKSWLLVVGAPAAQSDEVPAVSGVQGRGPDDQSTETFWFTPQAETLSAVPRSEVHGVSQRLYSVSCS